MDKLLTVEDVCRIFNIERSTLYDAKKKLPASLRSSHMAVKDEATKLLIADVRAPNQIRQTESRSGGRWRVPELVGRAALVRLISYGHSLPGWFYDVVGVYSSAPCSSCPTLASSITHHSTKVERRVRQHHREQYRSFCFA